MPTRPTDSEREELPTSARRSTQVATGIVEQGLVLPCISVTTAALGEWSRRTTRRFPTAELRRTVPPRQDIKPLNVMLTRSGAKLLDFNIASRVGDPVHTQSGTPPYQAPDADLTRWDVSTDLFAVGVLLYELLCNGTHPYPGSQPLVGGEVVDPQGIRPDLGDELRDFLRRACASSRSERFSTASEMAAELRRVRGAA